MQAELSGAATQISALMTEKNSALAGMEAANKSLSKHLLANEQLLKKLASKDSEIKSKASTVSALVRRVVQTRAASHHYSIY